MGQTDDWSGWPGRTCCGTARPARGVLPRRIGPELVATSDNDPASVGTAAAFGAQTGYQLAGLAPLVARLLGVVLAIAAQLGTVARDVAIVPSPDPSAGARLLSWIRGRRPPGHGRSGLAADIAASGERVHRHRRGHLFLPVTAAVGIGVALCLSPNQPMRHVTSAWLAEKQADDRGPAPAGIYFKMLIARAITSALIPRDTAASVIISSLAHCLIAETSVGLNEVAVQKASAR